MLLDVVASGKIMAIDAEKATKIIEAHPQIIKPKMIVKMSQRRG